MCEGRTMQEQLSRVKHDCMDAGGRATHGAVAEEARTEETKPRVMHGAITELPRSA